VQAFAPTPLQEDSPPERLVRRASVVGSPDSPTNRRLAAALWAEGVPAQVVTPQGLRATTNGDLVVNRVDVLPTLDGAGPGMWCLTGVEETGAELLNRPTSLYLAHDKLATAGVLAEARIPHPRTVHVRSRHDVPPFEPPFVVKPRFGSWGRDVVLCTDRRSLGRALDEASRRAWFRQDGALVQERIGRERTDLRVLVVRGVVCGAVRRVAAPGEWRTNIALGGTRRPADPDAAACDLAVRTVCALGLDLAGVDLMRDATGDWIVIEVNGAADFTAEYGIAGRDVFAEAAAALLDRRDETTDDTRDGFSAVPSAHSPI
jgi:ribosomal protein S6--L-glutamate ligase